MIYIDKGIPFRECCRLPRLSHKATIDFDNIDSCFDKGRDLRCVKHFAFFDLAKAEIILIFNYHNMCEDPLNC